MVEHNNKVDSELTRAKCGIVLLCHGSQRGTSKSECSCAWDPANTSQRWCRDCPSTPVGLEGAASTLQGLLGSDSSEVILSCLEFIEPHPDQAIQLLADKGISTAVVMPYLLGNGKHATEEMDEVLEELKAKAPGLEIRLAQGLGYDARLADVVCDRLLEMKDDIPQLDGGTVGVLLVKAGTKSEYDSCVWLEELGSLVEQTLGTGYAVEVAQSHYGDPTMEYAVETLVKTRGVKVVVCIPYVFFPGLILQRNIVGGISKLQELYEDVPMIISPPLGVDERIVQVAADRIKTVWDNQ